MNRIRSLLRLAVLIIFSGFAASLCAQTTIFYGARLAPLPVDFRSVEQITGSGQVQAELLGRELRISGDFSGLAGPATAAHLHQGPLAIAGPPVADLQLSKASKGSLSGSIQLDDKLLAQLQQAGLYVQIHSEAAPEGNLRGWLLPQPASESKR